MTRRPPAAVWCATALLGLLVVLWSVAVPMYRAVDEPQHLSTVLRLADGGGYPAPGTARLRPEVAASYPYADFPGGDARTFVPSYPVYAGPAPFPSYRELQRLPVPGDQVGQVDQMTQHPPLWPLLAAAQVRLLGLRDVPADVALVVLRILQGLLLLPVPLLVWRTARLLGASQVGAAAASYLPLLAPQVLHIAASVTDGDLLLLEMAVATPLLVLVAQGRRSVRLAAGLGLVVGLALLTKAFALLLPPCVLLAYAVGPDRRRAVRPALVSLVVASVVGGWWYALRLVTTGSLQPSGYPPGVRSQLAGQLSATEAAEVFVGSVLKSSWRDLGWLQTPGSVLVVLVVWVLVGTPVVLALRPSAGRAARVVALAPFALLLAQICLLEVSTYLHLHAVYGAQGRYLFPGLVGVAAVAAGGLSLPGRAARWARGALPLACLLAQVLALRLAVRTFWAFGRPAALAWSPLPVPLLAGGLALAGVAAVAGTLLVVRGQHEDLAPGGEPGLRAVRGPAVGVS